MSRKIKINTVNTTDLENTLNKNLCKKPVTISDTEKAIGVSNYTLRSEEDLKATLEKEKKERKEIRKTIDDSKKIVEKIREAKVNNNVPDILKDPITVNTGDAIASTKNCINSIFLYEKLSEEYINTVINPIFQKFCDNEVLINTHTKTGLFKPLFNLFKNNNIKSIDEVLLNDELNLKIGELLLNFNKEFNFTNQNTLEDYLNLNNLKNKNNEPVESIVKENIEDVTAPNDNTLETLCQDILKRYPHLKEKTSSILANIDNNPLEENKENRVSVTTDGDKNFIQNSKKYVEKHIIPRKKELERIEKATRNILNLPLDVTNPYEEVNHPDHYNVYDVEVVEMMERIFGIEETMSWCKLNAFKYRMRAGEKPTSTVEKDLEKEKWCLNKYKELKFKK